MRLDDELHTFFADEPRPIGRLLVAISGGADSTALLVALAEWKGRPFDLAAAHVNHHLRGAAADEDQQFVETLCRRFGVPLTLLDGQLDSESIRQNGIEAAARLKRYELLEDTRRRTGADAIATAHQADDEAETVLMRLISGSGIFRLQGIAPSSGHVVRPFLDMRRAAIEAFLRERQIQPRRDQMNEDSRYLRNRIRHEVLPLLASINPRIVDAFVATASDAQASVGAIEAVLEKELRIDRGDSSATFSVEEMQKLDPRLAVAALLGEIRRIGPASRAVSHRDLVALVRGGMSDLRRISLSKELEILGEGGTLVLRKTSDPIEDFEIVLAPGEKVSLPQIGAHAKLILLPELDLQRPLGDASRQVFQLPEGASRSFSVRNRRDGDRFQTLGSAHEKKLKEVLIDRKIPRDLRDRIPLLLCGSDIVWIAGVEVSEKFKVRNSTSETYLISIEYGSEGER